MTEVLGPVLVRYARFVEYRARRLGIVTELTQPDGQETNVAGSSAALSTDEQAHAAVHVFATDPAAGVQQS